MVLFEFMAVIFICTVMFITIYYFNQVVNKNKTVTNFTKPVPIKTVEWTLERHEKYLEFEKHVNKKSFDSSKNRTYKTYRNNKGQECMFFGVGIEGCTIVNRQKAGGFYEDSATFISWADIEEEFDLLKEFSPRVIKSEDNYQELLRKAELWDQATKELEEIMVTA